MRRQRLPESDTDNGHETDTTVNSVAGLCPNAVIAKTNVFLRRRERKSKMSSSSKMTGRKSLPARSYGKEESDADIESGLDSPMSLAAGKENVDSYSRNSKKT